MLGTPAPHRLADSRAEGEEGGLVVVKEAFSRGGVDRPQGWVHGALSVQPSASSLYWTTAVTSSWLSPSLLPSPSNPRCLPQPEQCFQTVNQITSLPTPLLPQLPITCRREAKHCPQHWPGLHSGGLGRGAGPFVPLQAHAPPCPPGSSHTALFTISWMSSSLRPQSFRTSLLLLDALPPAPSHY